MKESGRNLPAARAKNKPKRGLGWHQDSLRFRSGRVENGGFREPERSVLKVREPAHGSEIEFDFGKVMRKSDFYSVLCAPKKARGAVVSAGNRHSQAGLT
ncbi:hypothetical protein [Mesorhizobium sp.]|uniref:hypothetical protein n=1 Tax=Mesorhizobium sp. TaxID=1871066 RepID=UPI001205761C|nr:hypothetical protein [Mesorhizobium sp.]TIS42214.1 MAG: hypothetical protein E5W95_02930 [Mesorhizobium sp.]